MVPYVLFVRIGLIYFSPKMQSVLRFSLDQFKNDTKAQNTADGTQIANFINSYDRQYN